MSLFRARATKLERHRRQPEMADRPGPSMSYYSRRSDTVTNVGRGQPRPVERRYRFGQLASFWLHRFGLLILLITAVVCLVDVLSLSSVPVVVPVTASNGVNVRPPGTYQSAAATLLRSSIWNRNKLTVDTAGLERQLMQQFPELDSVSVTLPLLSHRPVVYVQAATPVLVISGASGSYVLGDDGKVLASADAVPAASQLPIITDQSGLKLTLTHQALTSSNVTFIQTVLAQLAARNFSVASLTLPAAASELDVHLKNQPYFIKFNLQSNDARQQAGAYLAVQGRLQSQNITPSQYIDVRVDGRAYYK